MKTNNICLGTGLVALDILVKENDFRNLSYYVGGSCGNVLMILSFLGWEVYPITRLGNDKNAFRLVSDMKDNGVHQNYIFQAQNGSTPVIIQRNIIDKLGNPIHKFELKDPQTGKYLPRFRPITIDIANTILKDNIYPNVFYFDRLSPGILTLIKEFKKRGSLIFFEPSSIGDISKFREVMEFVDILKFSNQRIKNYQDINIESKVILEIETMGKDGLRYKSNLFDKKWHYLYVENVDNFVDSSGAGDWTTSGIIYYLEKKFKGEISLLNIDEVEETINFAQRLGSLNCKFEGARGLMKVGVKELLSIMNF